MVAEEPIPWSEADPIDDVTMDFLEQMLQKNPQRRLRSGLEMRSHPYFHRVDWELYERQLVPVPLLPPRDNWKYREQWLQTSEDGVLSFGERYENGEDPDKGMFDYASEWMKTRELDEEALKEEEEEYKEEESEEVHRPGNHNEMRERRVGNIRVIEVFEDDNSSDEEEGDIDEPATTRRMLVNVDRDSSQDSRLGVQLDGLASAQLGEGIGSPSPLYLLSPMTPNPLDFLSPVLTPDLTFTPTTANNSAITTPTTAEPLNILAFTPATPTLASIPVFSHPFLSISSPNLTASSKFLNPMTPSKSMHSSPNGSAPLLGLGLINFRDTTKLSPNALHSDHPLLPQNDTDVKSSRISAHATPPPQEVKAYDTRSSQSVDREDEFHFADPEAIGLEAPEDNTDEHDTELTTMVTAACVPANDDIEECKPSGGASQHSDEAEAAVTTPSKMSPRTRFAECETPPKTGEVTIIAAQAPLRRANTTSRLTDATSDGSSTPTRKSPLKRAMTVPKILLRSGTGGKSLRHGSAASKGDGKVEVKDETSVAIPAKRGVLGKLNKWRKKIVNKIKKDSVSI
ncbi:hypothetical protein BDN72DRAFT_792535 [Pluteus cervinus]|uniref:Uncharacterized protein n=1 Tax=Pluteus cervinus TaxID=181527 RepID=A0ACD3B375_9AGAR|nr:hypothetical protein BDN72DRAFT_792535 [Pluteus cervinus]